MARSHKPPAILDLARDDSQFLLDLDKLCLYLPQLFDHAPQTASQDRRNARVRLVFNHRRQQPDVMRAVWSVDSEFSKMAPDRVDELRPLTISSSRTRWITKTSCCFASLIGTKRIVGRIIASQIASASAASFLLVLTKGLLSRQKSHFVAEVANDARPVMPAGTGFEPDDTRRETTEVRRHFITLKLTSRDWQSVFVGGVNLKHLFCDVETNGCDRVWHDSAPIRYPAILRHGPESGHPYHHARRKIYDVHVDTKSPAAAQALDMIARLFAIEADIKGRSPAERVAARRARTNPILDELRVFFDARWRRSAARATSP